MSVCLNLLGWIQGSMKATSLFAENTQQQISSTTKDLVKESSEKPALLSPSSQLKSNKGVKYCRYLPPQGLQ